MKQTITIEELKSIMFGRMDWFRVFRDAYESRKTSWWELGHIQEWRNATDEVLFAVWKQLEENINAISTKNEQPKKKEYDGYTINPDNLDSEQGRNK